jgi:hypothetical protein
MIDDDNAGFSGASRDTDGAGLMNESRTELNLLSLADED